MTPRALRAEARRIIMRGVRRLIAIELQDDEPFPTPPEIAEKRDAINASWTEQERRLRWLQCRVVGSVFNDEKHLEQRREKSRKRGRMRYWANPQESRAKCAPSTRRSNAKRSEMRRRMRALLTETGLWQQH